ncbi:MAG: glutamate formimidoyltransferase [Chitinophagaceae bacterium]|nr:MAG: glutamate formimidoyltransferase [Chitinophagaceae bacterium]
MSSHIIECIPNFSEGRDAGVIRQIAAEAEKISGVKLLDVDPGKATNRTVITFAGEPEKVIEAAFQMIKKAAELIDMSRHHGEHPRMGATDVCPLVPVSGISMEESVEYARELGKRVGEELNIPVYLYEYAATSPVRKNLSVIRSGEYEGLENKLKDPAWKPDYGKAVFNKRSGATVIGARDFLVAYNVNLNTTSVKLANSVAFDVRENGRVKKEKGITVLDEKGNVVREPGLLKSVKGIGWYIKEYGIAQVSMNLTDLRITSVHAAFEACCQSAEKHGLRVTGSELVGLIPLQSLLDAGKYFLNKQKLSSGVSENELVKMAVKSLGLDDLAPFDPQKKIIEYVMQDKNKKSLLQLDLEAFADETASADPTPGGGSVSAYIGALGAALVAMVANLRPPKDSAKDWDYFSGMAEKAQRVKKQLLQLVDEDTEAFNRVIETFKLPKNTPEEKERRNQAIEEATLHAMEIPLQTMEITLKSFEIIAAMIQYGNRNSVSDAGVAAICCRSAVYGACLNVKINATTLKNQEKARPYLMEASEKVREAIHLERDALDRIESTLKMP